MNPQSPLSKMTCVVTREARDQESMVQTLENLGARVLSIPTIERKNLSSEEDTQRLLATFNQYDWVVFTSAYAVQIFVDCLQPGSVPKSQTLREACKGLKVAAVGPTTAKRLLDSGIKADAIPEPHTYRYLPGCMGPLENQRILLPRSKKGTPELPLMLETRGAVVTDFATYTTQSSEVAKSELEQIPHENVVFFFTSGTTVRGLYHSLEANGLLKLVETAMLACIGPSTAKVCQHLFGRVDVMADPHTETGLIQALTHNLIGEKNE